MKHLIRIAASLVISYGIATVIMILSVMIVNVACSEKHHLKKSVGQRR